MAIPSTAQLERIIELSKKKDALSAELEKLDQQIATVLGGTEPGTGPAAAESKPTPARAARKQRTPRAAAAALKSDSGGGTLKDKVLAALKSAGSAGHSVGEIAEKLGWKKSSINTWLYTAGKKVREIKKAGRGRFVFHGGSADAVTSAPAPASALVPAKTTRKGRGTKAAGRKPAAAKAPRAKSGDGAGSNGKAAGPTLKDQVLAVLQSAGENGLSVGEVADKIGVKKPNLNVWFYTTGKKVKELKKVGPGKFALKG